MRNVHAIVSFAAVAAALAASPAEAAPGREPWATVGEWALAPVPGGTCFVARRYATGTSLHLTASGGDRAQLSVGNGRFNLFMFGSYRMSLIVGGKRRPIGLGSNGRSYNAGLSLTGGSDLVAQVQEASALELDGPDGKLLERLDLGGLAPALARVPDCLASAAGMPDSGPVPGPPAPPSPVRASTETGKQRPARPRIALSHLFDDYPAAALRAGEEGIAGFRLQVDVQGRVAGCAITGSSGSATLDSETCRILVARARFDPAVDPDGKPVPAEARGKIVWRIPPPPETPPPAGAR